MASMITFYVESMVFTHGLEGDSFEILCSNGTKVQVNNYRETEVEDEFLHDDWEALLIESDDIEYSEYDYGEDEDDEDDSEEIVEEWDNSPRYE